MITIGERVQRIRDRRMLSQRELSEAAGLSQVTISRIETNKAQPHDSNIKKIADALGVSAEWLKFGGRDEEGERMHAEKMAQKRERAEKRAQRDAAIAALRAERERVAAERKAERERKAAERAAKQSADTSYPASERE